MAKFSLVIWDWNGTLQDDLHHIYECGVERIFRTYGLPAPSLDEYRNEIEADFMKFYYAHGIPRQATKDDLNAIMGEGFKAKGRKAEAFPDALSTVTEVVRRGYPSLLLSGYDSAKLGEAVGRLGFAPHFLQVTGDVHDKPAAFRKVMDDYAVTGQSTAVIGDTVEDASAAQGVGATAFICPRGFHPRGRIVAIARQSPELVLVDTLADLLPHFP